MLEDASRCPRKLPGTKPRVAQGYRTPVPALNDYRSAAAVA